MVKIRYYKVSTIIKILPVLLFLSLFIMAGCRDDSKSRLPFFSGNGEEQLNLTSEQTAVNGGSDYLIGTGIYDITGPAAEVGMMGFAVLEQKTSGIHMRLRSRAFIIGDGNKRVVFVSADLGMLFQMVKMKVCEKIAEDPELNSFYNEQNVLLSATHTHSGPGGYSGYFLYDFTILGFISQNFDAIVDGIYQSILRAHNNLKPGKIYINTGTLDDTGWQRSQFAYDNNPAKERTLYGSNTDKSFTLLKFVANDGEEIGMINWFAVHPTTIGPENTLISGDSKGYASYLFEKDMGTDYTADRTFVAAFAQTNAGDVSPNLPYGLAPPSVDFNSNPALRDGTLRQYDKAVELYSSASEALAGSVDYRHEYVDMRTLYVISAGTDTCAAAMGASFSSGSPGDNPSPVPLFPAGTTVDSLNWNENAALTFLNSFFGGIFAVLWPATNDPEYKACHAEKPILLPTGVAGLNTKGIPMSPQVMPVQVIKIGQLAILAQPTEVTTMAGRRLKQTALEELQGAGVLHAVVAALSNSYASYMATREEYAMQSYAGACTQFGPNELVAFQQEFGKLCSAIRNNDAVDPGPTPRDITDDVVNFQTGVVLDDKPLDKDFGDVREEPNDLYTIGEKVSVAFWGGHPRNDLLIQGTFLEIEKIISQDVEQQCHEEQAGCGSTEVCEDVITYEAETVARDWDPQTIYKWERDGISYSKVTVTWDTTDAEPGLYRIRHRGHWKSGWNGKIYPYEGVTKIFEIQ